MYTAAIEININKTEYENECLDLLSLLLGSLRKNGQVLGKEYPISKNDNVLTAYISIPAENSLSHKFNNRYVTDVQDKLSCLGSVSSRTVGKDPESGDPCHCSKRKSLILFTNYLSIESPISCGTCFGSVPLYELPKISGDEYHEIICWESDYQSCDHLQMNCAVGERFALNQLSKVDSALNKIGIDICHALAKKCDIPVYYYLLKWSGKSQKVEERRLCPTCGGKWLLREPYQDLFDFKCDKCHLLSNIAFNLN
jgi:predicted  nucleic acid-binding Zn ribbon protein